MQTLMKIADRFGVPTAFAAVLCLAIWATGRWTATKIVEPLINGHVNYLKAEQEDRKELKNELKAQTSILKDIRNDQRKFPAVAENMP